MTVATTLAAAGVAVALALVAAMLLGVFDGESGVDGGPPPAPAVLRAAPAFSLPELRPDRPDVVLAASAGRPTVVNFFAAWCAPCRAELPVLEAAAGAHPEIAFVGVDHIDSREDAVELLDAAGIDYPAGYDPKGDVAATYRIRGMPSTVFIDAEGRIVELHQGQLSAAAMTRALSRLTLQIGTP